VPALPLVRFFFLIGKWKSSAQLQVLGAFFLVHSFVLSSSFFGRRDFVVEVVSSNWIKVCRTDVPELLFFGACHATHNGAPVAAHKLSVSGRFVMPPLLP